MISTQVFGRCGERECGGEGDDYDRLLASPRSLRSEADAFAKACGRFALLELLRDPAAAFSTLAGRDGECLSLIHI